MSLLTAQILRRLPQAARRVTGAHQDGTKQSRDLLRPNLIDISAISDASQISQDQDILQEFIMKLIEM
jgi:hypothetical protein